MIMNSWMGYFLYVISGMMVAVSQLLLKLSANQDYKSFIKQFLNMKVFCGYGLLFSSMMVNMFAMRYMDYKFAPILSTISYVFVLIFSVLLLKERISKRKCIGTVMILVGIILFAL